MRISILSMFPELFDGFAKAPVIARQITKGNLQLQVLDIKSFAPGSFRRIDDSPYGGGAGMILRCQPVIDALKAAEAENAAEAADAIEAVDAKSQQTMQKPHVIILDPAGKPFVQKDARRLCSEENIVMICGHYEGMDARIYDYADEVISIGDYVLTGGELPAMVLTDAIVRLSEGALRRESTEDESFEKGLLEYPQYTRPAVYEGKAVPEVLLSGNHEAIRRWRQEAALERTKRMRPDLLEN